MSGPWEKYKSQQEEIESGPWDNYKPEAKEKTSSNMAFLESAANVPLAGYLPQIQAKLAQVSESLSDKSNEYLDKIGLADENWKVDQKLKEMGIKVNQEGNDYLSLRDQNLRRQALQKEEHPISSGVGTGAGVIASMLLGPKVAPKGVDKLLPQFLKDPTVFSRLLKSAAVGAGYGGAYNPGDTEGELSPLQLGDRLKNAVIGGATGAVIQGGVEGLGQAKKLVKTAGEALKSPGKRADAKEIIEAGERLGIKPTKAMLSDSKVVQNLEDSLRQSPSLGGYLARKDTDHVYKGMIDKVDDLGKDALDISPFDLGERIKSTVTADVGEKATKAGALFDDLKNTYQGMELNEKSLKSVARNIRKLQDVNIAPKTGFASKARNIADDLENLKSVEDLVRYRQLVGGELNKAQAMQDKNSVGVLGKIYDRLTKLEENSIKRGVISGAKPPQFKADNIGYHTRELKNGYKVEYRPSTKDSAAVVKLYDPKGNEVGDMGLSSLMIGKQKPGSKDLQGINFAEIKEAHRGKGLYKHMVDAATYGSKKEGFGGIESRAQSPLAQKVWQNIENKKVLPPDPSLGRGNQITELRERPSSIKAEIGKEEAGKIIGGLREGKKQYSNLMKEIEEFARNAKVKKGSTPQYFLDNLENVQNEQLVKKLSNVNNVKLLKYVKEKQPEIWEGVRGFKLNEIMSKATNRDGNLSPAVFLREVKKLSPESRKLLFGSDSAVKALDDLKTFFGATPYKVGPSGTPQGIEYLTMLNPVKQAVDLARYGAYKTFDSKPAVNLFNKMSNVSTKVDTPLATQAVTGGQLIEMARPERFLQKVAENPDSIEQFKNEKLKSQLRKFSPKDNMREGEAKDFYKQNN